MTFSLINMFPMKRNIKDNLGTANDNQFKQITLSELPFFTRQPINYEPINYSLEDSHKYKDDAFIIYSDI